MQITLLEKRGEVRVQLTGSIMDRFRDAPGRTKWVDRVLTFEPTAANVDFFRREFPEATWIDGSGRLAALVAEQEALIAGARSKRADAPPEAAAFPFKKPPRAHQLRAFTWARARKWFALFMDMGTGKTKTTIDIAASKWCSGEIETLLVLAPNGVHEQWLEPGCRLPVTDPERMGEVPKHMSDSVEWLGYVHRAGRKPPPDIFERTHRLRILAINIEALSHSSGVAIAQQFINTGRCMIAVDESTTIKTPGSARSKAVRKLGKQSAVRAILCGAPITRSIEDMYGQALFLHEDALGFSSFYTFRNRYCHTVPAYPGAPHGVVRVSGHKNMEEFTQKVDLFSFRVRKDECLDLPPKVFVPRYVELTAEQRRLYKSIAEECFAQLGERIIDVENAVGKIMRLQQVLCGHLPGERPGEYETIDSNRITSMMSWLDDCGDKVVIWARFIADVDLICAALKKGGISHVRYDGQVPAAERAAGRERWLTDRTTRVMVSNPAAAARGQNWQIASDVGYFSNSFDADHRWQSEDRTHRDGMRGTCTYTDFQVRGSVDTKILTALRGKKSVADAVLDDPKAWQEVMKL